MSSTLTAAPALDGSPLLDGTPLLDRTMATTLALERAPFEHVVQARPRLCQAEVDARRESLRRSAHESLIEGARPDPATDYIFEAYIRGQIDAGDLIPWLDKHYGATDQPA